MAERRQHSPYSFYENILQTQSHHRTSVRARLHRTVPQRQTLPQGRERIPQPPVRLGFAFTADSGRDRTRRIQVRSHPLLPPCGTDLRQDTRHRTRKHPPSDLRLRLRHGVDAIVPREGRQMADGEHSRQGHSRRASRDQEMGARTVQQSVRETGRAQMLSKHQPSSVETVARKGRGGQAAA